VLLGRLRTLRPECVRHNNGIRLRPLPGRGKVNNWGPNAAQSKVDAGSVDVCINFSGLSGGMHYLGVGPDNRAAYSLFYPTANQSSPIPPPPPFLPVVVWVVRQCAVVVGMVSLEGVLILSRRGSGWWFGLARATRE
jgi:hypothetical protein